MSPAARLASRARAATLVIAVMVLGACSVDEILEQDVPSRVAASTLGDPSLASLLVDGAAGDFECAFAQYIIATGLAGDELLDAQLSQAGWDYDRRTIFTASIPYGNTQCGATQVPGLYTPLSVARFQADDVLRKLQSWTDAQVQNRTKLLATAATYGGYSLVLLGEAMCSAAIDLGPEIPRAGILALAEQRFTTAIEAAQAANDPMMLNAARVGRARTRLNLGNLPGARSDAVLVPDGFVWSASYSSGIARRENLVWSHMHRGLFSSVDSSFRNLTWAGAPDPRVVVVDAGVNGHDSRTRIFRQMKYPLVGSSIPIARSAEAQLIVAEADLAAGNANAAVAIINQLHSKAGIAPYAGGTAAEVKAQIIEERRRELFLEGQRFGDIIRYDVTVRPLEGTAFNKGGTFGPSAGSKQCFPLPDIERNNNPNIPKV